MSRFANPLDLLRYARERSPFYAELYASLGEQPGWAEVPPVEPEHYWARKARAAREVQTAADEAQSCWVWTTGGSTSRNKRVLVSTEDFAEEVRAFKPAFETAGIVAGDRVANLTWAGELSASFILTSAVLQALPVVQLPILAMGEIDRLLQLCRELRPTVLLSFPFLVARLAARLRELDEVLPVPKLLYAGERLRPELRALVRERFAVEHIACFGYGAVDCGPIASAGPEPEPGLLGPALHPLPDYSIVELLDEHGQAVGLGELGRVTITNLGRYLSPVIRFQVGDLARWVEAPRVDAQGVPRGGAFVLEGRAHRSLKLAGWIVTHAGVVEEAMQAGLGTAIQLVRERRGEVDWLRVRVGDQDKADASGLSELRRRLLRRYPKLCDPPGRADLPVLVVERCALGDMQLSGAGKIVQIVDRGQHTRSE